jgi:hypothetical protein
MDLFDKRFVAVLEVVLVLMTSGALLQETFFHLEQIPGDQIGWDVSKSYYYPYCDYKMLSYSLSAGVKKPGEVVSFEFKAEDLSRAGLKIFLDYRLIQIAESGRILIANKTDSKVGPSITGRWQINLPNKAPASYLFGMRATDEKGNAVAAFIDEIRVPKQAHDVRFEVERLTITTENSTNLVIIDEGSSNLLFGDDYYFDKLVDGDWTRVPSEAIWFLILYELRPGDTTSLEMSVLGLDSGRYRVSKEVEFEGTGVHQTLYSEFLVKRPFDEDPNVMPRWGVKMSYWLSEESLESPNYPMLGIINLGMRKLIMEPEYNIEKWVSDEWEPFYKHQSAGGENTTIVGPGVTYKQILKIPDLNPGRYRIDKPIGVEGTKAKTQLQIEFGVRRRPSNPS